MQDVVQNKYRKIPTKYMKGILKNQTISHLFQNSKTKTKSASHTKEQKRIKARQRISYKILPIATASGKRLSLFWHVYPEHHPWSCGPLMRSTYVSPAPLVPKRATGLTLRISESASRLSTCSKAYLMLMHLYARQAAMNVQASSRIIPGGKRQQ